MTRKTPFEENREAFVLWLINNEKLLTAVAKDYASRCRRIEKHIASDLDFMLSKESNFVNLSKLINQYSLNQSATKTSAYSLNATLRSAAKKYGVFRYPELTEAYRKRVYYHY